jgi:transcriptional regulator with XRE-family HTH domain
MSPAQFKVWRKSLGLKQKEAAEKLGLKKRMIQYYETGKRDGKKVEIPKAVRLACFALASGVEEFDGLLPKPKQPAPEPDAPEHREPLGDGAVTMLKKARARKQNAA